MNDFNKNVSLHQQTDIQRFTRKISKQEKSMSETMVACFSIFICYISNVFSFFYFSKMHFSIFLMGIQQRNEEEKKLMFLMMCYDWKKKEEVNINKKPKWIKKWEQNRTEQCIQCIERKNMSSYWWNEWTGSKPPYKPLKRWTG